MDRCPWHHTQVRRDSGHDCARDGGDSLSAEDRHLKARPGHLATWPPLAGATTDTPGQRLSPYHRTTVM